VTCLRFATACGMSDRLRLDLVVNDFVACAVSSETSASLATGRPGGHSYTSATWHVRSTGQSIGIASKAATFSL
jgi:hypothetical protein